eukprot:COSAG04_NODE_16131_length_509_cov_0.756098_2_plen_35_part_01
MPSTETEKLLTDESVEQAAAAASLDTRPRNDQVPC